MPRHRCAVVRVVPSRQAEFVAVVDQRRARPCELQHLREPAELELRQPCGQPGHVVVAEHDPGAQDLLNAGVLNHSGNGLSSGWPWARAFGEAINQHAQVQAKDTIECRRPAWWVGPHLSDDKAVTLVSVRGTGEGCQDLKANFRGNVQSPSVCTPRKPCGDDRVLCLPQVLLDAGALQAQLDQTRSTPPNFVAMCVFVTQEEPIAFARLLVVDCLLEVRASASYVVEYSIKDKLHSQPMNGVCKLLEIVQGPVLSVNLHVVGGVVLVIGKRLRNRLQVEHVNSQVLDVICFGKQTGKVSPPKG
mmetsp:Transcript_89340/g.207952  ORF Transcript_89340/g.207952 Transcript_89340/m.207952 type:complete len:304 (-) Transcript_89340:488-1399(-)